MKEKELLSAPGLADKEACLPQSERQEGRLGTVSISFEDEDEGTE